ncbi:MAG: hypothetical protein H6735_34205 [Alphaproteobacteria bacterium]|nr:hypothetical protein [Alphaproteobacteria bacterium]MCB9690146.1 hypothetical protein [Alphaproteobacteria bacterium]
MSTVPPLSPLVTAATLLVAIPLLESLGMPHPSRTAVVDALDVSRSQAYALRERIEGLLPTVQRPPGRPVEEPPVEASASDSSALGREALAFVYEHPGSVTAVEGGRRTYTDAFRCFVLALVAEHRELSVPVCADTLQIPVGTLRDWLEGGVAEAAPQENAAAVSRRDPTEPQVATLLDQWSRWKGGFTAFCRHVQHDWRIPFKRTLIAEILAVHGVRFAKRRSGRSPDEDALRGQFQTFFPNAQWVGDGSPITVQVASEPFTFNVELMVDPCSGAVTGASVRDNEDGEAVVEAFRDGVVTTGAAPLAVLLDNKPSNHTDAVVEALDPATVVPATLGRPQNKAHVEGAFGLFQQVAPVLALVALTPKALARQLLESVVTTWARTLNHRPRAARDGRSRVELHRESATPEQIAAAEAALAERLDRQRRARETLAARQDPQVRALLSAAFGRLGFVDPTGNLLTGVARYPIDAVVEGIAIVEGKRRAGTLPDGVDVRYLLGVTRNVAEEREGWEISLALWDERRRARDAALHAAERERDQLDDLRDAPEDRLQAYVDRALRAPRRIDRFFWLIASADVIDAEEPEAREPLFRLTARRISATFAVPHRERLAAIRFVAARVLPIA